mmetsp:Transcript_97817/g.296984  ORF Transcript_97817/g.296984 Transcript_97817/m.296984 type:complete len:406 (+) Transcript_97817:165-1382(+)
MSEDAGCLKTESSMQLGLLLKTALATCCVGRAADRAGKMDEVEEESSVAQGSATGYSSICWLRGNECQPVLNAFGFLQELRHRPAREQPCGRQRGGPQAPMRQEARRPGPEAVVGGHARGRGRKRGRSEPGQVGLEARAALVQEGEANGPSTPGLCNTRSHVADAAEPDLHCARRSGQVKQVLRDARVHGILLEAQHQAVNGEPRGAVAHKGPKLECHRPTRIATAAVAARGAATGRVIQHFALGAARDLEPLLWGGACKVLDCSKAACGPALGAGRLHVRHQEAELPVPPRHPGHQGSAGSAGHLLPQPRVPRPVCNDHSMQPRAWHLLRQKRVPLHPCERVRTPMVLHQHEGDQLGVSRSCIPCSCAAFAFAAGVHDGGTETRPDVCNRHVPAGPRQCHQMGG